MPSLLEKDSCVESLQEGAKVHGSPSPLAVKIAKRESSLEMEKMSRKETANIALEMKSHANEALGALEQEKGSRTKDREAYKGRVARVRKKVDESLQQTLEKVCGACDQAADQGKPSALTYLFPACNWARSRLFWMGPGGGRWCNVSG